MADAAYYYKELLAVLDRIEMDILDKKPAKAINRVKQARTLTRGLFRFIRQDRG
jgi:hypothetical protein